MTIEKSRIIGGAEKPPKLQLPKIQDAPSRMRVIPEPVQQLDAARKEFGSRITESTAALRQLKFNTERYTSFSIKAEQRGSLVFAVTGLCSLGAALLDPAQFSGIIIPGTIALIVGAVGRNVSGDYRESYKTGIASSGIRLRKSRKNLAETVQSVLNIASNSRPNAEHDVKALSDLETRANSIVGDVYKCDFLKDDNRAALTGSFASFVKLAEEYVNPKAEGNVFAGFDRS